MIVELNGLSLTKARAAAHRFLERTVKQSAPRQNVSRAALKIERERMRKKVAGTKKLRNELLAVLDAWRSSIVDAVRKTKVREADVDQLDAELTGAVAAGVLSADQKAAILAAVNAALASMDPQQLTAAIKAAQEELFQAGLTSGKAEVGISWDIPPLNALEILSQTVIPFSQQIVDREVAAINQALQDGIEAGDGIPQLADRIQDTFDDGMHILDDVGQVSRVIPSDSWAEMVARTETARAMNAGIFTAYRAAGVSQAMFIAAEDERTCPVCQDLDGSIFVIGREIGDSGSSEIPIHPNCRCTSVSAKVAQDEAA